MGQSRALQSIRCDYAYKNIHADWLTSKIRVAIKILWVARILGKAIIPYLSWHTGEVHLHNSQSSLSCQLIMFNHQEWFLKRQWKILLPCVRTLLHACSTERKCCLVLRVETLAGHIPLHRLPALPLTSRGLRRIHWFTFRPSHIAGGGPESVNFCLQYYLVIEGHLNSSRWHTGVQDRWEDRHPSNYVSN